MEEGGIRGPLYAKSALHNVWRRTPFLDTETFSQFVSDHGLPIIQFSDAFAPRGNTVHSLVLVEEDDIGDPNRPELLEWTEAHWVYLPIINAVGIPAENFIIDKEYLEAGLRSVEVMKKRANKYFGA
jgi:hypothetical protein